MLLDFAISAFVTVFVVVDPIAMAPTFLVVTDGMPQAARKAWPCARASLPASSCRQRFGRRSAACAVRHFAAGVPDRRRAAAVLDRGSKWCSGCGRHEGEAAETGDGRARAQCRRLPARDPAAGRPWRHRRDRAARRTRRRRLALVGALVTVEVAVAASCLLTFRLAERISGFLGVTGNIVLSRLPRRAVGGACRAICRRRHSRRYRRLKPGAGRYLMPIKASVSGYETKLNAASCPTARQV